MKIITPKYPSNQDYVIKDGTFIGEFEQMYQDYNDPWFQSVQERWASDKAVALHLIRKLCVQRVMELGCGLGYFTNEIAATGVNVLGIDISPTAIRKAKATFLRPRFRVADVLEFHIYRTFQPDIIVFSEITWYILDSLRALLTFLKTKLPDAYILHLCALHPPKLQKYGNDTFTSLPGIMAYFGMQYKEWGEIHSKLDTVTRTYFLGRWKK